MNILDRLPQKVRELLIMLISALFGWAADSIVDLPAPDYIIAMAGALVAWGSLNWTTLTKNYGVGSTEG